ncbi:LysR family transcriptional regulator [Paenibacillus thermotolerans]|uniref:LysR family transcriptional regulator n=1 Tax=Paenibacillus thermotolerans TaxID=3027807 RepID=UPI00236838D7|nr:MULTISPECIES: LysR family transcriptional regulator [unclassified Paenibacillus]
MELLQLQYFLTTAKLEHMTKAAEQLHITQPALSKMISRLEEDVGVPLFDRTNRQIRLNSYGKVFLAKVEASLSLLEEGRKEVKDMAGLERGTVSIATNALSRLSPAIAVFRERYPDVSFRINQIAPAKTGSIAELLEQGGADLGFGPTSFQKPGIRELPVLQTEVFLAVPRGHRYEAQSSITLEQVADDAFIEYKIGHPFRQVNDEISRKAGIKRNIVCEVEEPAALGNLVQAGLGVAFVPSCKGDEAPQYTLLSIAGADNKRAFSVSWYEARYLSKAARQFQRFLVDYFANK